MSATAEAFIKELLNGADPKKLASFLREIKPDVPKVQREKVQHGPVKQYSLLTKDYTCISCGSVFSVTYKMEKGEQTSIINQDGTVCNIIISGKSSELTFKCYCSICTNCKVQAGKWTRDELEARWYALVESCSFQEKRACREMLDRFIKI